MTGKPRRLNHSQNTIAVPDLFVQTAQERDLVVQIQQDLRLLIQTHYPDTDKLVETTEQMGLPVITQGPEFHLKLAMFMVGAQDGYIAPTLPKYPEFVKTLKQMMPEKAHLNFSTGFIIMTESTYHFSFLCYQLYHWMAYKKGLPGYEDRARRLYVLMNKKYGGNPDKRLLSNLDYAETMMLKTAIRRDREALQFLRRVLHEVFIPKNNGKLFQQGKAQG